MPYENKCKVTSPNISKSSINMSSMHHEQVKLYQSNAMLTEHLNIKYCNKSF